MIRKDVRRLASSRSRERWIPRRAVATGILVIAFLLPASIAVAVGIRGRVDFFGPRGTFPMMGAFVELCDQAGCMWYRTGDDGMYYFDAHPGPHLLRINGVVRREIFIPNAPYFDIAPVQGN